MHLLCHHVRRTHFVLHVTVFLDPSVDPKTLCPWCDERLPDEPTPHLHALISATKRVSRPEDQLTNPLGLRAPPAAFVGVCQRHRFEHDWIPHARQKGWPTKIAWDRLADRIIRLKTTLQAIVNNVDEDFVPSVAHGRRSMWLRKENEFWLIMKDLSLLRDKAIQTLHESVEYGVTMFPADNGEGDLSSGVASVPNGCLCFSMSFAAPTAQSRWLRALFPPIRRPNSLTAPIPSRN
ncbi:hypothetical protein L227DRAFT_503710 [Lentinus tigrinus ALCF2SS1-6]|uniref:Uncharacterized protein n=1 Tax=Lentinus tigrinus ALCF2SS1-6 TaxID=1328759 RepID=A0A5C2S6P5_9APHY|nr:hypothetical protein L227DRAFT_503710 [Lentinus tigrinus ALCF2SS1-6]